MTRIIILGAGPCGIGAAYQLSRQGHADWQIFERHGHIGGLSASFLDDNGFTWDVGGHVLFSHYVYFDDAVKSALGDAYFEHLRESWIRILNTWVPYPFQNNIRHLPTDALAECMEGLRKTNHKASAKNFYEWIHSTFGTGIARYFLEPYNRKVWGVPLESMSRDWIGERVSVVDLGRIEKNIAKKRDDVNWGPNNTFKFPKHGGTGAIFEGIARPFQERILFRHEVERIDLARKEVFFANGIQTRYEQLLSTIPLDQFVAKCTDVPGVVREAAKTLVHNGGLIVGIGVSGARTDPKCWMYFPEENAPFYRVTNFHNYSPYNVPQADIEHFFSLICETSYSSFKQVDKNRIVEDTIQGLINSAMIKEEQRSDILSHYLIDIPYSYPVPTIGRDAALAVIQPYLESQSIFSRGRFGAWKYEVGNMDHSFMQGVEAVDRVLLGKKERVLFGKTFP
jgi:protoporphyrinogen oxidase